MWEAENVGSSWKISSFRFPKISCTQMYIWDSQEFGTDFNFLDKYSFKMLLNSSIFWRILTFSKILKFSGIPKFSNCEILSEPDLSRSDSSRPDPSRSDPIWIDSTRTSGSRYFQFLAHLCVTKFRCNMERINHIHKSRKKVKIILISTFFSKQKDG